MNKEKIELWFDGVSITKGKCSAFPVIICLKQFNNLIVCDPFAFYETKLEPKKDLSLGQNKVNGYGTSLTEDNILRWYNESESTQYRNGVLTIDTDNYTFSVFITKEAIKGM